MEFLEFRQFLSEQSEPAGIRNSLNDLQDWWNENAEKEGFMSPPKVTGRSVRHTPQKLYPIMHPPIDRVRVGGILVMGYNPRASDQIRDEYDKLVDETIKKHGKMPDLYDKSKKRWYHTYDKRPDGKTVRKKYAKKMDQSYYDTKEWYQRNRKRAVGSMHSEKGAYHFQASILKMFEDIELDFDMSKIMSTNYNPFPSNNATFPAKGKVDKACVPFLKSVVKTCKPSMIVCSADAFKAMRENMNLRTFKNDIEVLAEPSDTQRDLGMSDKNPTIDMPLKNGKTKKVSLEKYFQVGSLDGVPVVCLLHWTGHTKGGPTKATWNNLTKREIIGLRMNQLIRQAKNNKLGELQPLEDENGQFLLDLGNLPVSDGDSDEKTKEPKYDAGKKPPQNDLFKNPRFKARKRRAPRTSSASTGRKPSKATFDPRFDSFEKLNADRLPKGSTDYKEFYKDAKKMNYDDLLAKWAVPGKLKRP